MDYSSCPGRASAIFIGVYEPTKQKLLSHLPENLSAVAHIVSWLSLLRKEIIYSNYLCGDMRHTTFTLDIYLCDDTFDALSKVY